MIQLNIGVPGSGKTYFVVKQLVDIAKSKNPEYTKVYTNINGLLIDELNKINDKVVFYKLNFDDLSLQIQSEYDFYIANKRIEHYDELAKENKIFENYWSSLIVIDECQMLLLPTDENKRFVTYHRHFKIDLIFITQAKHLLDKIFLVNVEKMIVAQPPAKRFLSSSFRYYFYPSVKEYKTDVYQKESLSLNKNVYKYYDSGSTKVSKSAFLKFIAPIVILAFSVYGLYLYAQNSFSNHGKVTSQTSNSQPVTPKNNVDNNITDDSSYSIVLSITCYGNGSCFVKDNNFVFLEKSLFLLYNKYHCKTLFDQKTYSKSDFVIGCSGDDFLRILQQLNTVPPHLDNNSSTIQRSFL